MRASLLAASLLTLIGIAGAASAQTASSAGTTNGTSSAINSVTVNAYTGLGNGVPTATTSGLTASAPGTGTSAGTGSSGSGDPTVNYNYSGHTWTTPVVQGGYFAGANPCLIGIGGGAAGGPVGLNFTLGRSDQGCQRRSDAAAWHALGRDDVAVARMCQDEDNRAAYEAVGLVCPQDRAKAQKVSVNTAQAPAATPPAPAPALPVAPASASISVPKSYPDWCGTVSPSEWKSNPAIRQQCGWRRGPGSASRLPDGLP